MKSALNCVTWGFCLLLPLNSWAWGRREHQIVGENAAQIAATQAANAEFMRAHSFDFGYYANVPDPTWRINRVN